MKLNLNGYLSEQELPKTLFIGKIRIEEDVENRRKLQQSKCSFLNRKGIDCCVAPRRFQKENCDIVFLGKDNENKVKAFLGNMIQIQKPIEVNLNEILDVVEESLKNRIRTFLQKKGFLSFPGNYVSQTEIQKDTDFKEAVLIQSQIIKNRLILWIRPKYKIMKRLNQDILRFSDTKKINVRVLPKWRHGILRGKGAWEIKKKPSQYWKETNKIAFVKDDEEMVKVEFESFGSVSQFTYPISCVFQEFEYAKMPDFVRMCPNKRIEKARKFLETYFYDFKFLGLNYLFTDPVDIDQIDHKYSKLTSVSNIQVLKKENGELKNSIIPYNKKLMLFGDDVYPLGGSIDVKYIVIYPEGVLVGAFFDRISEIFRTKNFGNLRPYVPKNPNANIKDGFYKIKNTDFQEYEKAAMRVQELVQEEKKKLPLIFVVLPIDDYSNEMYYSMRRVFFSPYDENHPKLHTQSIESTTLDSFFRKRKDYSLINIIGQVYTKGSEPGIVPWVLEKPADHVISGMKGGNTCYSYYDISRRAERKTHSSVYTAITDSYGRIIYSGSFPTGSEKLDLLNSYDMILSILRKSVIHEKRYADLSDFFRFKRLVFAKDGQMYKEDVEAIRTVLFEGIEDKNRKPLFDIIKADTNLPNNIVIDLVSVNKSPKKEIYNEISISNWKNVVSGTCVKLNERTALLVSSETDKGTNIPLEISLMGHFCLGIALPEPKIEEIVQEYYNLTHLNWNSFFKKSKYALPQLLTQSIGENLTAGVIIPENYLCL